MNKHLIFIFFLYFIIGCSEFPDSGQPLDITATSPVNLNLDTFPYPVLSGYNFFNGPIKNQEPVHGVLPYDLINSLFTDYVHKKRFIWMPEGVKASFITDTTPIEFPEGAAVIKNFYYDNVLPDNVTKILETRLMVRKNGEWVFANYIWNDEQTEAYLDMNGRDVAVTWNHNGNEKSTTYRIPSEAECFTCHKLGETAVLIGPKPNNLNKVYAYEDGIMNQMQKWINHGYLEEAGVPPNIQTLPSWTDATVDITDRVRAYLEINCAHCHSEMSHCSYRPVRFAWQESHDPSHTGVCEPATEPIDGYEYIVQPGNHERSSLYYRFVTNEISYRMPFLGRSIVDEEAAAMLEGWINDMNVQNCE